MKRTFIVAAFGLLSIAAMGAVPSGEAEAEATPKDKVVVCHATSGQGELKNGYNLIEVSVNSVQLEAHQAHATTNPKVNQEFGDPPDYFLYDYIDVDPADLPGKCGTPLPPPPPTPELIATAPTLTAPTCSAAGVVVLPTVEGLKYTSAPGPDGSIVVTVVATEGYVLEDDSTTSWTFTAAQLAVLPTTDAACIVPVTPTQPPAETPVVAALPPTQPPAETVVVAALPPTQPPAETVVLAAVPAASAPAAAPTALPTTGSESWPIFLIGLASVLGGAALVKLSRHPA